MAVTMVMDHPLIQHKIGIMRDKNTSTKEFRALVAEVAQLVYYESSRNLELADKVIETPLVTTTVKEIAGKKLCVVPILRAGLHMADGILNLTPNATARKAAQDAINGWDPTYGCIYYFNPNTATSSWIWSRPQVIKIGKHIFCK